MAEANASNKRQKTSDDSTTSSVIHYTKNLPEDLVIKVAKDDKSILLGVNSAFLKIASPVFEAMLAGKYIEGSTSYTETTPLNLEDDDPTAMTSLLGLLHHHFSSLPASHLPALVVTANKYDCIDTVRPWYLAAVSHHFTSYYEEDLTEFEKEKIGLLDAACIAFVLGEAALFKKLTRNVIIHCSLEADAVKAESNEELLDIMPSGFLDTIRRLQLHERAILVQDVQSAEKDILAVIVPNLFICRRLGSVHWAFTCHLFNNNLHASNWATKPNEALKSVWTAVAGLEGVMDSSLPGFARCGKNCRFCSPWLQDLARKKAQKSIEDSKKKSQGLCLECVQAGTEFDFEEKCSHGET